MNEIVHSCKYESHCVRLVNPIEGINHDCNVVIPVKEGQGTLAEDNEGCIAQLHQLGETEYVAPDGNVRDKAGIAETDSVVDAIRKERSQHGRKYRGGPQHAKHC